MKKLTKIANKCKTDKGTEHFEAHGYTEIYNDFIPSDKVVNLLEIGIWHGDSIRMWNEYNININVFGIDIDQNVTKYIDKEKDKCTIFIGNQSDKNFLENVLNESNELDVIIDDGSHYTNDIISSFKVLYPKLKPGAIYFIEDLHASQANLKQIIDEVSKYNEDIKLFCNNKLLMVIKNENNV